MRLRSILLNIGKASSPLFIVIALSALMPRSFAAEQASDIPAWLAAFRDGLRALNYVEGQNINIEYRWAEGNLVQLPALAKELVDLKVETLFLSGFCVYRLNRSFCNFVVFTTHCCGLQPTF
jgi:putative tryptophan/tyrosine transport system substrate-binding protein